MRALFSMDLWYLWETFPEESCYSFFLENKTKQKIGEKGTNTVISVRTTGHSRGSFLSTRCSPVIRSFLGLTVGWRDGLMAGGTQGPIHSEPQSQSTSGIQTREDKDFEIQQKSKKMSLKLEMNY